MADITMCEDDQCPMKKDCYRFTAHVNEFRQSYFTISPREKNDCDYFWDNERKRNGTNDNKE